VKNLSSDQQDFIESHLKDVLPHGAGIDCEWSFKWLKNGKLKAVNSYHCMNDIGYYDGYADFTVIFPVHKALTAFALQFNGKQASYKNNHYMLRDYIEDTIYSALEGKESIYSLSLKGASK